MATRDRKKKVDGFTSAIDGIDSYPSPNLLKPTQLSFAVNVSLRGGYMDTRPPFIKRTIVFENTEMQDWVETHNIQCVKEYIRTTTKNDFVFSSGGRIFLLRVKNDFEVSELTPIKSVVTTSAFTSPAIGATETVTVSDADEIDIGYPIQIGSGKYIVTAEDGDTLTIENINTTPGENTSSGSIVYFLDQNPVSIQDAWMEQAEQYLVIQNGRSKPIIWDGAKTRRAGINEIPTGRMMAYVLGRLWVSVSDTEYVASDIVNGETGVLGMTENNLLTGGGKFKIPDTSGGIVAMKVVNTLDTTLGQGPLQIVTRKNIYSVNAPAERDAWREVKDPIQTVSVVGNGGVNQYSVVNVNGDIFYRSTDGVRSFIMARREFGTWGNTPISTEINRILKDDDEGALSRVSSVLFDNRVLITCGPIPEPNRYTYYHRGIVSLNFDPISSMAGKRSPVWEGLWTGIQPYMLFTGDVDGKKRCFSFCKNKTDGKVELWEILKEGNFDAEYGRIVSFVETMSFGWQNYFEMVKLQQAEIWVDRVVGTVDFNMKYRPDQYPCWFDWPNDIQVCSKYRDCSNELSTCLTLANFGEGYRTRLRWGRPPELVENFDNKPADHMYECQFRLQWTGKARIKGMLFKAYEVQEEPHAGDLS